MSIPEKTEYLTPREYLEGEALSNVKHEYIDGQLYAMSGATRAHNRIIGNIFKLLDSVLSETPCSVYFADVKVRVPAINAYFYPDLVVSCDERDDVNGVDIDDGAVDDTMVQYPRLIVEILSKSTEAFDRGMKFAHYRRLESLQEYVLIRQDTMSIERNQREADGVWSIHPACGTGEQIRLSSLDLTIPVDALYAGVRFPRTSR